MSELIDFFSDFKIENIGMLIILCVVIISIGSSYIQIFHASPFEAVLMNRSEESKRFFFIYVIMFFVFAGVNYFITVDGTLFLMNTGIFVLTSWASSILKWLYRKGKAKKAYWWLEERKGLIILMTTVAACIFGASMLFEINRLSCVVLGALVEVFAVAIFIINTGNVQASIIVTIKKEEKEEKWYVFKRIDEKYLLCGDNCRIDESQKTRLIDIENIVSENICFKKEIQEIRQEDSKKSKGK